MGSPSPARLVLLCRDVAAAAAAAGEGKGSPQEEVEVVPPGSRMDPRSIDPFHYADLMKAQGNQDFKNGNYSLSIKKYDEAISVLACFSQTRGFCHQREMAVLLCNRSNAFYNLNKWNEAYCSARDSLQWDPTYVKGYYRVGYSLIKLLHPVEAAEAFCQGLSFIHRSSDVAQVSDFIVGIFSSANNMRAISTRILSICEKIVNDDFSPLIWQQVIEKLAKKGLWQSCLFLASKKDKLPKDLRVADLSLKDLFEKYVFQSQYEKMEKVPKLVEWLISIGANLESLGTHPLHAIIMLCIKARGNHLFQWLLDHKPEMRELINQQDEDGSTVLHIVALQPKGYPLKNQIEDVVMLLIAGGDPRICDKQSRSAMDILKKTKKFKVLDVINKHIARYMSYTEESSAGETESKDDAVGLLQDAFEQFVQFCLENTEQNINLLKHGKVQKLLKMLSAVKEIPGEIVCDIPPALANRFIKLLLGEQRWHEVLLLLTRAATEEIASEDGPLKNCSLSDLDIGTVLEHLDRSDKRRVQLIKCLIERGASPEGTGVVNEKPIQKCLKNNDFELAYLLLHSGADPCCVSVMEGDTPLHAALTIYFDKNDYTGVHFLQYLLELYYSNPTAFPYLNPNSQDKNGNTVLHIIFQKNLNKQIKKMLGLLAKFDINLNLKNASGRDVSYKKKKNDPMLLAWKEAVTEARKKYRQNVTGPQAKITVASNRSEAKSSTHSSAAHLSKTQSEKMSQDKEPEVGTASCKQEVAEDAEVKISTPEDTKKVLTLRECHVHEIIQLIQKLTAHEVLVKMDSGRPTMVNPCSSMAEGKKNRDEQICAQEEMVSNGGQEACLKKDVSVEGSHGELDKATVEEEEEEEASPDDDSLIQNIKAHIQDFDKMTWEIECTPEMLKKLGNKSMSPKMKNKVISVIQQLGNGDWTQGLQKRLEHLKSDIQLYEAKLSKGARMLWEVAVDFSPRCSDSAETIIENEHSTHPSEKTGRVYSEIIRIWDIVLDHNKLDHAIEVICIAWNRGRSCILRKKLKCVEKASISSNVKIQKRFPCIYIEDSTADKSKNSIVPEYFPPASAVETEYNIMKFHSFSTNMALNIINDMTSAVEYPFRVGELEYAIIGLNHKPLEPIILIGRSGTGKTTCCLYRLWKNFYSYWVKAQVAEGPLLVRQIWQRLEFNMQLEAKISKAEDPDEKQNGYDPIDSIQLELSVNSNNEQEADADDQHFSTVEDSNVNSVCDCDEVEEYVAGVSDKLEHLHQIFITKNHVLCQEVQRNFVELSKSSKETSHFKPLEANIYSLQDVKDENFPLFLTSKQFLLLLDVSLPDPFFLRNEDGSLKHSIAGWSTKEDSVISNWQEEDEDIEVDYDEDEKTAEVQTRESDPRVFVTYSVFAKEIWPKMVKGRHPYNPALVWKEIKSFLKGSFEAMNSPQGILSEEDYKHLGRKRSPNFKEDRGEIYQLFCLYQQIKCQGNYFDEEDFLYKMFQRLSKLSVLPWCIHELYADEIQDFTQAELALLMKCIDDPNAMFLTGDTAQSIMKGVAFRFSDLRSLFHYASKSSNEKKRCIVRKPRRIYQLYQNYRSHSGILQMASGVVDLLQYYFPESFDRLPRDRGLFDGPQPTVLKSCSVSDLAILLRGNKRKAQPIEFGAHQVILVANEIAKEKIPEELNLALVLTIYEAKGLEFDDVLLYNFFTDSEAYKEWKIISSFPLSYRLPEETELILEIPLEKDVEAERKCLLPNPEMYKMLNGELKQLYTAITRARVNLWIFDENSDRRAPAFQYFIKRQLVQVVTTDENKDLDDTMFVRTSTPEEWVAQGEYYAKHQCWMVAAKCYQKGGASEKAKLALAHDAVLKVQSKKISVKEKQMEYMDLAKTYLECNEPNLALKCLFHAKEYQLCGQLCEKLGKVKEAAYLYKRGQCYKDAYRCFEQIQEFDLAVKMCCQEELYEEAAKSVERYEKILQHEKTLGSRLSYSANQFYLEAAAKYLHANKTSEMRAMLSHLGIEDQLVFLKTHKQFSEAADLLKKRGRDEEAAKLMKQHGFVLEAAKLTNQPDFRASCLLAAARRSVTGSYKLENVRAILKETLELCEQTNQSAGRAEATYLMGILEKDFYTLKRAFLMFLNVNHNAGAVEALFHAVHCEQSSEAILRLASHGIEELLNLVKAFQKADTNAKREMVKSCFEYFGIVPVDKKMCRITQNEAGCVLETLPEMFNLKEKKTSDQFLLNLKDVETMLNKHLLKRFTAIAHHVCELRFPNICTKFIAGLKCEDNACEDFHKVLSLHEIKSVFQCKMYLAALNGLFLEARQIFSKDLFHEASAIDELLTADIYALCKSLINVIFPKHFHLRLISENPISCKSILTLRSGFRTSHLCKMVLREYIRSEFENETAQNRRESSDLWLRTMQVLNFISYPEEFERLLVREEDGYNRELKLAERMRGRHKGVEGKYGMLMPDKYAGGAESIHLCFIRLLQYSMDQLYAHRNPEKCRWLFFRFMNVLVKKCVEPLVPSIGNTVTLLEFQFLVSCAVLMRLCKSMTLCLPKSYISLFHYWDFLFTKGERHKDIFSVIQEYKPENTKRAIQEFKSHLMYLADVLCTFEHFNVLLDAFEDLDYIMSGEAERTVVLCLVMLVNADQVLSWKYKRILVEHFPSLQETLMKMKEEYPSKVPERLIIIVDLVSRAVDIKEVVAGLKDLLHCRDEEFLADCSWRWDPKGTRGTRFEDKKEIRGIYYKISDLNRFSYLAQAEYFDEPEAELENDTYVGEREDPLASIASVRQQKQQQKALAKRKLRCLFLFVFCLVRWKRISSAKPAPLEMTSGIFKKADIDTTQCDLCGVKFLQNSSNFISETEHSEKEPLEATSPTEADWEEAAERNENFVTGETFENHLSLGEHRNKHITYQKYFEWFRNKVEPLINNGMNVLERIAEMTCIKGHVAANEEAKLVRRRIEEDLKNISDMVDDLYKRKAWADAQETVSKLADHLKSNVDNAVMWLDKAVLLKEEEFDLDKDLDNEEEGEERTFEELNWKKPSKKKGKTRRK